MPIPDPGTLMLIRGMQRVGLHVLPDFGVESTQADEWIDGRVPLHESAWWQLVTLSPMSGRFRPEPIILENPAAWLSLTATGASMPGSSHCFIYDIYAANHRYGTTYTRPLVEVLLPASYWDSETYAYQTFKVGESDYVRRQERVAVHIRGLKQAGTIELRYRFNPYADPDVPTWDGTETITVDPDTWDGSPLLFTEIQVPSDLPPNISTQLFFQFPNNAWCESFSPVSLTAYLLSACALVPRDPTIGEEDVEVSISPDVLSCVNNDRGSQVQASSQDTQNRAYSYLYEQTNPEYEVEPGPMGFFGVIPRPLNSSRLEFNDGYDFVTNGTTLFPVCSRDYHSTSRLDMAGIPATVDAVVGNGFLSTPLWPQSYGNQGWQSFGLTSVEPIPVVWNGSAYVPDPDYDGVNVAASYIEIRGNKLRTVSIWTTTDRLTGSDDSEVDHKTFESAKLILCHKSSPAYAYKVTDDPLNPMSDPAEAMVIDAEWALYPEETDSDPAYYPGAKQSFDVSAIMADVDSDNRTYYIAIQATNTDYYRAAWPDRPGRTRSIRFNIVADPAYNIPWPFPVHGSVAVDGTVTGNAALRGVFVRPATSLNRLRTHKYVESTDGQRSFSIAAGVDYQETNYIRSKPYVGSGPAKAFRATMTSPSGGYISGFIVGDALGPYVLNPLQRQSVYAGAGTSAAWIQKPNESVHWEALVAEALFEEWSPTPVALSLDTPITTLGAGNWLNASRYTGQILAEFTAPAAGDYQIEITEPEPFPWQMLASLDGATFPLVIDDPDMIDRREPWWLTGSISIRHNVVTAPPTSPPSGLPGSATSGSYRIILDGTGETWAASWDAAAGETHLDATWAPRDRILSTLLFNWSGSRVFIDQNGTVVPSAPRAVWKLPTLTSGQVVRFIFQKLYIDRETFVGKPSNGSIVVTESP
jgi:hypothetical protein